MVSSKPMAIVVTVENDGYFGDDRVYLSGTFIGRRPYDGASDDQIVDEVLGALGELVAEKLKLKGDDE